MLFIAAVSCGKDKQGCTESNATNYNPEANIEDGSCEFTLAGLYGWELGTMTDQEGNSYQTIKIGEQEWMAENLKVATWQDGTPIQHVTEGQLTEWEDLNTAAWSNYNNDDQYDEIYGKLYNWYATVDSRNVCPSGWHVPSNGECNILSEQLGGTLVAGGKLKSVGFDYWESPNTDATNESGFSGLPSGLRDVDGEFYAEGINGYWWTVSEGSNGSQAYFRRLSFQNGYLITQSVPKQLGLPIRCVKD